MPQGKCPAFLTRTRPITYSAFTFSLVPKVVETWREDLISRNRPKLAARIASPSEQPDSFGEGWEDVLEAERSSKADGVLVDV